MKYALKNMELIPEADAVLPVTRREFFSSFAVYESLKVLKGRICHLNDHIERLFESAEILNMDHHFKKESVAESLPRLISANNDIEVSLKLQLIGGKVPILFAFTDNLPVYPSEYYQKGVRVISYKGERIFPSVKSNCLLLNYIAAREAREAGALDALLVNRSGYALEGSRSNLFALKNSVLITSGRDVLYGVTRKYTILEAEKLGMTVQYKKILLKDLKNCSFDEVFITSTSMGAIPVKFIDDIIVGDSFPMTSLIHKNLL